MASSKAVVQARQEYEGSVRTVHDAFSRVRREEDGEGDADGGGQPSGASVWDGGAGEPVGELVVWTRVALTVVSACRQLPSASPATDAVELAL